MKFPYEEFDLSGVTTYPLKSRASKARVEDFNRAVRAAKAAMREYRRRRSGLARLEVAFNRCLDAKILFTRFGRVEITTNASGLEEAGEDADTR